MKMGQLKWIYYKLLLLIYLQRLALSQDNSIVINTRLGQIKGLEKKSVIQNITYYTFNGIPYSEPRVGEKKFDMPTLNDKPWNNTLEAIREGPVCPQLERGDIFIGDEDCLRLTIHTPCATLKQSTNSTEKFAVMFVLRGGRFLYSVADENFLGPDFLIAHGVIVVIVTYRIGPLGFINTGTKSAPGNAGLKDQATALKWINKNIADYCGDPNKVTIVGSTAAGKMAQYHGYSPMSKGLYHAAIQQSPYGTNRAVVLKAKEAAFNLGRTLGINTTDPEELMAQLKRFTSVYILKAGSLSSLEQDKLDNINPWVPSTETPIKGEEIFLPDFPCTLSKRGPIYEVPYLMGVNSDEGGIYIDANFVNTPEWVEKNIDNFIPININITNVAERKKIDEALTKFYFYDANMKFNNSRQNIVDLISDANYMIAFEVISKIRAYRAKSKVYRYLFNYRTSESLLRILYPTQKGCNHFDELEYIFYSRVAKNIPQPGSLRESLTHSFTTLWTNFAKYGNPLPKPQNDIPLDSWKPLQKDEYLEINVQNNAISLINRKGFLKERMRFWLDNIFKEATEEFYDIFN